MEKTLKSLIVKAVTVEILVVQSGIKNDFANAINAITTAVFLGEGHPNTSAYLDIAILTMSHLEELFKHILIDGTEF